MYSSDSTDEAPNLNLSYTVIEQGLEQQQQQQSPDEQQEPEEQQGPRPMNDNVFDAEGRPFSPPAQQDTAKMSDKTKTQRKPRQRKDMLCEICGGTYSSKTKSHKCKPPYRFCQCISADPA